MKKLLTFFVLGFFALFISSSPICSINQELNKDTVSKLSDFRKQTINTCLSCKESICKLKEWPEAQKGDANVCKFCYCVFKLSYWSLLYFSILPLTFSCFQCPTGACTHTHTRRALHYAPANPPTNTPA